MNIEISSETLYGTITVTLLVLQVWQYYRLNKLEKSLQADMEILWKQIALLISTTASKIIELDKKITDKNDYQSKK